MMSVARLRAFCYKNSQMTGRTLPVAPFAHHAFTRRFLISSARGRPARRRAGLIAGCLKAHQSIDREA